MGYPGWLSIKRVAFNVLKWQYKRSIRQVYRFLWLWICFVGIIQYVSRESPNASLDSLADQVITACIGCTESKDGEKTILCLYVSIIDINPLYFECKLPACILVAGVDATRWGAGSAGRGLRRSCGPSDDMLTSTDVSPNCKYKHYY